MVIFAIKRRIGRKVKLEEACKKRVRAQLEKAVAKVNDRSSEPERRTTQLEEVIFLIKQEENREEGWSAFVTYTATTTTSGDVIVVSSFNPKDFYVSEFKVSEIGGKSVYYHLDERPAEPGKINYPYFLDEDRMFKTAPYIKALRGGSERAIQNLRFITEGGIMSYMRRRSIYGKS